MGKKVAVILAGCGVYDGSEIHESVLSLLHITQLGASYKCFAPDKDQLHVIDHTTGDELAQTRNVLVESARIARGEINALTALQVSEFDILLIPGGFGAAKNLNQWAVKGADGEIDLQVEQVIKDFHSASKTIAGLCMGPTVIAQALAHAAPQVTVGTDQASSPYDIAAIAAGINSLGAQAKMHPITEVCIDRANKIVTAPCYMMDADIAQVNDNVRDALQAALAL
jgi:enhancing lycopene biosynthesis protein 2